MVRAEHGRQPLIERASMRAQERSAYVAAGRLLDRERPDAVVAQAERYTPGVLRAARERGLRVPGDLRVAAAVDSPQARDADPPVTAIDLQPDVQGAAAVEMLIAILAGDEPAGAADHARGPARARLHGLVVAAERLFRPALAGNVNCGRVARRRPGRIRGSLAPLRSNGDANSPDSGRLAS